MQISQNLAALVGNTPLLRLARASEDTGCDILGKAEFLNPGQSVKDRAALFMINEAVARGSLKPGGTIVEGTAGNTGIGLALVGASMGYRTVIVIPETQSQEKKEGAPGERHLLGRQGQSRRPASHPGPARPAQPCPPSLLHPSPSSSHYPCQ